MPRPGNDTSPRPHASNFNLLPFESHLNPSRCYCHHQPIPSLVQVQFLRVCIVAGFQALTNRRAGGRGCTYFLSHFVGWIGKYAPSGRSGLASRQEHPRYVGARSPVVHEQRVFGGPSNVVAIDNSVLGATTIGNGCLSDESDSPWVLIPRQNPCPDFVACVCAVDV